MPDQICVSMLICLFVATLGVSKTPAWASSAKTKKQRRVATASTTSAAMLGKRVGKETVSERAEPTQGRALPMATRAVFLRDNLIVHRGAGIGFTYRKGAIPGTSRNIDQIFHKGSGARELAYQSLALSRPGAVGLTIGLSVFTGGIVIVLMPLTKPSLGSGWLYAGAMMAGLGAVASVVSIFPMAKSFRVLKQAIVMHNQDVREEAQRYPSRTQAKPTAKTAQPRPQRAQSSLPPSPKRAQMLLHTSF